MNRISFSFFLALVFLPALTWGQNTDPTALQAPTIPAGCYDTKLVGNDVPAFFAARKTNTGCTTELGKRKAAYLAEKEALAKLKGSPDLNAIDAQNDRMEAARDRWLEQVNECGNCAASDIEVRKIQSGGRTEYWYIADGSCQVQKSSAADLLNSYQIKMDSLLEADGYRHYAPGGLPTVLDYHFIDNTSGKKLADPKMTAPPFFSFIAIRGPVVLGTQASFGYYYKNEYEVKDNNGVKEYLHSFHSVPPPRGFQYPSTVAQALPSGRTRNARLIRLSRVQGKWCITSNGYLRYYTAADLGMDFDFAKKLAHSVLLTTLGTVYERGVGEVP